MTDSFSCKVLYTNIGASNYPANLPAKPRVSTISHHNLKQRHHVNQWICDYYQRRVVLLPVTAVSEQHWQIGFVERYFLFSLHPVSAAVCTPTNKYLAVTFSKVTVLYYLHLSCAHYFHSNSVMSEGFRVTLTINPQISVLGIFIFYFFPLLSWFTVHVQKAPDHPDRKSVV